MNRRQLFKSGIAIAGIQILRPLLSEIAEVAPKAYSFKDVVGVVETPVLEILPEMPYYVWPQLWQVMLAFGGGECTIREIGMMAYRVRLPKDTFRAAGMWLYQNRPIGIHVELEDLDGKLYNIVQEYDYENPENLSLEIVERI